MNIKKIIQIAVLAAIVFAVAFLLIRLFPRDKTETTSPGAGGLPPVVLSTSTQPIVPSGEKVDIGTSRGIVSVKNFYKNRLPLTPDQDSVFFASTEDYNILYFARDSSFSIGLLRKPVQEARGKAEKAFLDALKISKEDACKLDVYLGVPVSVDGDFAGRDYRLSFCPNGVQF